jgi:TPP-dependent pyruvate/acetoin dehydrogenase alpha subunit
VASARAGLGPSLLEVVTYRIDAHFPTEAAFLGRFDYRTDAEIDSWRRRDPIGRLRHRLLADGTLDQPGADRIHAEVERAVAAAFAAAEAVDGPAREDVTHYRYFNEVTVNV